MIMTKDEFIRNIYQEVTELIAKKKIDERDLERETNSPYRNEMKAIDLKYKIIYEEKTVDLLRKIAELFKQIDQVKEEITVEEPI